MMAAEGWEEIAGRIETWIESVVSASAAATQSTSA